MSDAIITVILTQLAAIMEQQIRKEIRLVSGVKKDVKKLTSSYLSIKAVLVDAEKRQVTDESVKLWLVKLTDVSYDTEVVLSEWITAMREADTGGDHENQYSPIYERVCSFVTLPCLGFNKFALHRDIALKIKDINRRLDVIAVEKDRYKFDVLMSSECPDRLRSTSFTDVSRVQGRDLDKSALLGKLVLPEKNQEKDLNIVSIVGVYAIGKTTLAQVVFNSSAVINHFNRRIWERESYKSDGEQFHLGELTGQDSWALFSKIAFYGRKREECEQLEDIGKEIAEKCRGLPPTVKHIAYRMRSKSTLRDWEDVLSSEFWKLEGGGKGLLPPQLLS
ncbi:hypothetical protein BUALT_Bualt04G0072900 [Buddleja alternifolia]|uniref:Uncharacterized protein n=1 Tax=Buddleja alternifolia TaxID=168488 RepID=A0AAV6XUG9_9LAMI|nr:hypothetical protein BUALT_Bualt04G0072900 [Buddleja alternifolia]